MIRIEKPTEGPESLRTAGARKCAEHCAAYDSGDRQFTFSRNIYAASAVKSALIAAQHGKCCFCESLADRDGDVEHFRPKSRYYWLAYEWDNLLLCCSPCNTHYKGEGFPLVDETTRAQSHTDDISREEPLLIHPVHLDPAAHITFNRETVVPFNDNQKGRITIDLLQLNRTNLLARRLELWKILRHLMREIAKVEQEGEGEDEVIQEARQLLAELTAETAEFTAMARTAITQPLPPEKRSTRRRNI